MNSRATRCRRASRARWLPALLVALATLLPATSAAGDSAGLLQSRVWALDLAGQARAQVAAALTLDTRPACTPSGYDFASGSLLAARGGGRLSYHEFRTINAGRFANRKAQSLAWKQYGAGQPGDYLTSREVGFLTRALRIVYDDRSWDAVRVARNKGLLTHRGADWTWEHFFIPQRMVAKHPRLQGFANSYANTFLRIPMRLNARIGQGGLPDLLFKAQVGAGVLASGAGGYFLGTQIFDAVVEE